MKKIIIAFISLLSFENQLTAQLTVKANVTNLAVGLYEVQAEYGIADKYAVQLGVGFMPNRDILLKSILQEEEAQQLETYEESLFGALDFTGFRITPEFKLYTGEDGTKGFYWDFWTRYSQYDLLNPGYKQEYENTSNIDKIGTFNYDASLVNFSVGVGLGTQWFIYDKVSIDVLWLGVGYTNTTFIATTTSDASDIDWEKWRDDTKQTYEGNEYLKDAEVEALENGLETRIPSPIPVSLRSSISIGFKF